MKLQDDASNQGAGQGSVVWKFFFFPSFFLLSVEFSGGMCFLSRRSMMCREPGGRPKMCEKLGRGRGWARVFA